MVNRLRLADFVDSNRHAQTVGADFRQLVERQLIHEGFPLRVVRVDAAHVDELQIRLLAEHRPFVAVSGGKVAVGQHRVVEELLGHRQLHRAGRHRAFPVAAGVVGHCVVAAALVAVHVRRCEQGGDIIARAIRLGVGRRVEGVGRRVNHRSVAVCGHAVGGRLALHGQDIVCRRVRVIGNRQVMRAFFQNIHARVVSVVAGQEVFRHGDGHRLALARLEQLRLREAHKLHCRLFNVILHVVVGIGLLRVDLHRLLARLVARVGNGDSQLILGLQPFADLLHLHIGESEVRVAQPVAEGVRDDVIVLEVARVRRAQHNVLIARFRVLVAQIHAFLIDHIVVVAVGVGGIGVLLLTLIGVDTEVVLHRVKLIVLPPSVRQRARRVHRAGKHVAQGVQTRLTDRADPQHRVHAVILFIRERHRNRVRTVDDDGDGADIAVVLHALQAFQNAQLVLVEVQIVAALIERVLDAGADVVAFAAHAADDVHYVFALSQGIVMVLFDLLPLDFADFVAVALLFLAHIPVQQGLVHHVEARAGQHVKVVRGAVRVHRAGARTTVDGIHRRHADEGHLCARGKRQDAVLILHQHNAFALDLANLRVAGGFQFGQRAVLAVIVADVALFGHAVRELGNDFGAARAEEGVELHFALVGDDTARDNQRRQARRDIQEHFFQRPMLGGRFHKNRVLLSNDVYSDTRKNAL